MPTGKGAFKSFFCPQNKIKLHDIYFNPPMQAYKGTSIPHFKINAPFSFCPLQYLIACISINKMVKEHTVDYHPSPSVLTSRIHRFIFTWTLKALPLSKTFVEFSIKPLYPTMAGGDFQIYGVQTTGNAFVSQKLESSYFYSCHPGKTFLRFLSSPLRHNEITLRELKK